MASSTKKLSDFGIKAPKSSESILSGESLSSFSKWVPLICAGAAVGVSVLALKEIKNVRKELISFKKESASTENSKMSEKIELMDEQLRKITQYLANQTNKSKESPIIKNAVKEKVKIINEEQPIEEEFEVEYVEEEVTDDEES